MPFARREGRSGCLLGYELADSTVAMYRVRSRKPPSQTWKSFLTNHVGQIVSDSDAKCIRTSHRLCAPVSDRTPEPLGRPKSKMLHPPHAGWNLYRPDYQ